MTAMKKKTKIILIISAVLTVALACTAVTFFCFLIPQWEEEAQRQRMVQEYYDAKYKLYAQENEAYADYQVDVAFLGDSLTDGCDLNKYYPQYETANRGIGGETSHGLLSRMQLSAYDLKPKVVVMLIGGNNLDSMFDSYEDILRGLQTHLPETKVILVSLTAMGRDYASKNHIAAYNNVKIRLLAEKYGFDYVDVFSPLLDPQTNEIRENFTNDGAHLTHEGYLVLQEAITPAIDKALAEFEG